jgi:hypothetical protein
VCSVPNPSISIVLVMKHKSPTNYAFIQDVVCRTLTTFRVL